MAAEGRRGRKRPAGASPQVEIADWLASIQLGQYSELFAENGDAHRQALAYGNQAAALQAMGNVEEAEALYLQSADLLGQLGEDQMRATVLRSLSEMQLRSGRAIDAVISMQDGVSGVKKPRAQQRIIKTLLQMPNRFLG